MRPTCAGAGPAGNAKPRVIKCDGTILHRDHWLTPEEQAAGPKIMPCVSRFEGKTLSSTDRSATMSLDFKTGAF
jgi:hypothetical protein